MKEFATIEERARFIEKYFQIVYRREIRRWANLKIHVALAKIRALTVTHFNTYNGYEIYSTVPELSNLIIRLDELKTSARKLLNASAVAIPGDFWSVATINKHKANESTVYDFLLDGKYNKGQIKKIIRSMIIRHREFGTMAWKKQLKTRG